MKCTLLLLLILDSSSAMELSFESNETSTSSSDSLRLRTIIYEFQSTVVNDKANTQVITDLNGANIMMLFDDVLMDMFEQRLIVEGCSKSLSVIDYIKLKGLPMDCPLNICGFPDKFIASDRRYFREYNKLLNLTNNLTKAGVECDLWVNEEFNAAGVSAVVAKQLESK